jgi:hypothetical protein
MDLVRYASSAYLMSWEWPKPVHVSARSGDPSTERGVAPWILAGLKTATVMFLLLAAVGMMPWSARLRGVKEGEATPPQPWWRVALWLGLWMVIPIYFMYCRSVPDFDGPRDWWTNISKSVAGTGWADEHGAVRGLFWWTLGVAAVVLGALVFVIPGFRRAIVRLVPLWALVALLAAVLRAGLPGSVPAGTNWIIVVTRPLEVWWDWMSDWPVVIALLIVLPGLALFYCARNWPQRLARVGQLALVVAALLGSCYAVYAAVDAKFKKEVAQALEPRAGDVKASVVIARHTPGEVEGATERVAQRAWQSIFMPRYVGFVWIAFCIALCALLMRLPTRGLRIAAVVIVVGVNMAQFSGRLFAGTEPPLDELARDIWAHDSHNADRDKTARVYVNESPPPGAGHPGYGWLNGQQGKYYLGLARGYWIHPTEWKNASSSRYFDVSGGGGRRGGGGGMSYSSIAADVRSMPQAVKRVIVWEQYISQKPPAQDPLLPLLGNQWQKATDDRDYDVRFHWTWADLNTYRRSEYVRK